MTQSATLAAHSNTASTEAQELQSDALIERLQWRYAAKKTPRDACCVHGAWPVRENQSTTDFRREESENPDRLSRTMQNA